MSKPVASSTIVEIYTLSTPVSGVPTVEPSSLILEIYSKLCGLEEGKNLICTHYSSERASPTGELPLISVRENQDTSVSSYSQSIDLLKRKGFDLDNHLDQSQIATSHAFITLVEKNLRNAMLWNWWMEEANFEGITKSIFAGDFKYPLFTIVPTLKRRAIASYLRTAGIEPGETVSNAMYKEAARCYNDLSILLGSNKYFFGDRITTLDVIAFSYLFIQLNVKQVVKPFREIILQHTNLVEFVDRFHDDVFKSGKVRISTVGTVSSLKATDQQPQEKFSHELEKKKIRNENFIFAGLAGGLLLFHVFKEPILRSIGV